MNGHEPQNVHTELFQAGQVFCKCIEGPFRGMLPHVDFINGRIGGPSRVRKIVGLQPLPQRLSIGG